MEKVSGASSDPLFVASTIVVFLCAYINKQFRISEAYYDFIMINSPLLLANRNKIVPHFTNKSSKVRFCR